MKVARLRALFIMSAVCALTACSGGSQQVAPATPGTLTPGTTTQGSTGITSPASQPVRAQESMRSTTDGNRSNGDDDNQNGTVVYNSIPKVVSSAISSLGFECCQVLEFGDGFKLTHTGRLDKISVVMDSWGCQVGGGATCVTSPGSTFNHPITLNVYAVTNIGGSPGVGALLGTKTQTFAIPYRPSADPVHCPATPTKFFSSVDHTCVNGLANVITYDFSNPSLSLPAQVIVSVAYNTSTGGYHPIGTTTTCFVVGHNCGYDSLNVSANGPGGPIGSVVDPNGVFINYSSAGQYCDPSKGTGFRLDTSTDPACSWSKYHPQIKVTISGGDGGDHSGHEGD